MIELALMHTPGYLFRIATLGFAAFVLGIWGGMMGAYLRGGFPRKFIGREWLLGLSALVFIAGYVGIQIEAVFLNPNAVLLWGNFAFPVGLVLLLLWELAVIRVLVRISQREP